jgi:hypothetical protein
MISGGAPKHDVLVAAAFDANRCTHCPNAVENGPQPAHFLQVFGWGRVRPDGQGHPHGAGEGS